MSESISLEALTHLYDAYVATFGDETGKLPEMMALKRAHTDFVVCNARQIAHGESFSAEECEAALIAALLHDVGRYEQLKRYNTFRDADSVDHAVFSYEIAQRLGWLAKHPHQEAILKAVLFHNRREVPLGLDQLTERVSWTVRDADKLDIFRVLEDLVAHTDWRNDSRPFWNLEVHAAPNPIVLTCLEHRQAVSYQDITSLADFVLIQVGWMISGLYFATSRHLCAARGHLDFRRRFLRQLTDEPRVEVICDMAAEALKGC